jgi:hypothetical protein
VLVLVENKKPSLFSVCCLDPSEIGVAKIDTYAEMLESVDPTEMEGGFDTVMNSLEQVAAQPERICLPGVPEACATLDGQNQASLYQFRPP